MLQMDNLDDRKSEWNLNEAHLIIPMIEGDVIETKETMRSPKNSLNIAGLDGTDQMGLTNALENSLVIELERNFFETQSNKEDFLVIQNSDIKLFSCGNELKYSLGFASQNLAFTNAIKGETIWEGKDGMKPDWSSSNKIILEEKDVLHYDNDEQPVSKTWNELEKSEQILSSNLQTSKMGEELFLPIDSENKSIESSSSDKPHFIVNYLPSRFNTQFNSLLLTTPNCKQMPDNIYINSIPINKAIEDDLTDNLAKCEPSEPLKSFKGYKMIEDSLRRGYESVHQTYQNSRPSINSYSDVDDCQDQFHYDCVKMKGNESKGNSLLPEKSLPLKKKAKMKRSVVPPDTCKVPITNRDTNQIVTVHQAKVQPVATVNKIEKPNAKKSKRWPGADTLPRKQDKRNKCNGGVSAKRRNNKSQHLSKLEALKDRGSYQASPRAADPPANAGKENFKNIFHMIDQLRNQRLISSSVWQTLHSGLQEMATDILKEMNMKKNEQIVTSYSVQLKAFALVLYFKQPAAFNYLSKIYRNGWPSLKVIKEWKHKVNTGQTVAASKR